MFDQRFLWTSAAVMVVAALSFFLSQPKEPPEIAQIVESVSGIEREAASTSRTETEYSYILKEHNGRVAVYAAGEDEPQLVLDVPVKYLPDYDRSQMAIGIPVKNYDELVALIEDYTS